MEDAQSAPAQTEVMSAPEPVRENMVATAIKFLQNPKVRESTMAQRRSFLEKKGLTTEEINVAIERSGTAVDEYRAPQATAPLPVAPMVVAPVPQPVPVSTWSRTRDYMATVIVIGGVSYGIYKFYKKFLEPLWFGPSREEVALRSIQKSVEDMQKNLQDTLLVIQNVQTSLGKQQENVEDIVRNSSNQRGSLESIQMQERSNVEEVKDEIKSLKGLLLNRKQFPSMPASSPVLPSWQLTPRSDSPTSAMTTSGSQSDIPGAGTTSDSQPNPTGAAAAKEMTGTPSDGTEQVSKSSASRVNEKVLVNGHASHLDTETASETVSTTTSTKMAPGLTADTAPIVT